MKTGNRQTNETYRNSYYQQLMRQLYYDIRFFYKQSKLDRKPSAAGITKEIADSHLTVLVKGLTSVFRKVDTAVIDEFIHTVEPEPEVLILMMKPSAETLNDKEAYFLEKLNAYSKTEHQTPITDNR